MRVNEAQLRRIAEAIVHALVKKEFFIAKEPEAVLIDRVHAILVENFRQEEAIEAEAEAMAEPLIRKNPGVDARKIVFGIKVRLAQDKGFTL